MLNKSLCKINENVIKMSYITFWSFLMTNFLLPNTHFHVLFYLRQIVPTCQEKLAICFVSKLSIKLMNRFFLTKMLCFLCVYCINTWLFCMQKYDSCTCFLNMCGKPLHSVVVVWSIYTWWKSICHQFVFDPKKISFLKIIWTLFSSFLSLVCKLYPCHCHFHCL